MRRQREPKPHPEISIILGLDLRTDTVVINCKGDRVWLKDAFLPTGRRVGVTECCPESAPCAWHKALSQAVYPGALRPGVELGAIFRQKQ